MAEKAGIDSLFRDPDAKVLVEITDADGEPLLGIDDEPMGIFVTDVESDACKKVINDHTAQVAKLQIRGKTVSANKNRTYSLNLLVAAIVGFTDSMMLSDGKAFEYSEKNARKLLKKSPMIYKQVNQIVGADELFTEGVSQGATGE